MTITIKDKKIAVALKKRSLQTGEKIYALAEKALAEYLAKKGAGDDDR